ncbi:MAG: class I SAM-dependent methyltransferase [Myxococcota bacterium]
MSAKASDTATSTTSKSPASKRGKAKDSGKKSKEKETLANRADKYECYLQSVQDPAHEVKTLRRLYKEVRGAKPRTLREDFCGSFAVCCEWARSGKEQEAWGVDYDAEPLQWGSERNLSSLGPGAQQRVHVVQGDVRTAKTPKVDIVTAQNFSYYIFREREEMRRYFRNVHKHLVDDGVFILDMLGGPQVQEDDEEEKRKVGKFIYVWHQERFNPINHGALFHIHFEFKDGSRIEKAFTYDWRLWTMPEIREILAEAGFSKTHVFWEDEDENGEGNGRYYRTEDAPADLTWLAYIVAER